MRLNKYISASGFASRRRGEILIAEGRVKVNGVVVTDPARNVDPETDEIEMNGKPLIVKSEKRYFLLNKPAGYIVTKTDTHGRNTVMELLGSEAAGLFPVGRLDIDTTGVLILTDDGDLAQKLTHPSFGVDKKYLAVVYGKIDEDAVRKFREGLVLEDGPVSPAELKILKAGNSHSVVEVVLHQGKKRQVKRMLLEVGYRVKKLERISFGGLTVKGVPIGKYRRLTPEEVEKLLEKTGSL